MTAPFSILPDTLENRVLADTVHPADWVNPEPADRYNLAVVGGGTAGLICAAAAAGLGAKVALIEQNLLGGDCLNTGCVPSKALIRASRAVHEARSGFTYGVRGGEQISSDFSAVMERMRCLRTALSQHDSARRFRDELGVDVFIGTGRFSGPNSVEVGTKNLFFKKAAICTGARAAAPLIHGLADAGYLTNETVFSLTELPPHLAVIGAGPLGCELAQAFQRLGSQVTVLETGPQILGRDDQDAAAMLFQTFVKEGIELRLGSKILSVQRHGNQKLIRLEQHGQASELLVDEILVGVGRTPNTEDLGLEKAGVAFSKTGVTVNDYLQTSNPHIYAAGDICSSYKFTHLADAMARILVANALFKGRQRITALTVPWCIYTDPEIAHVGMYEQDARAQGISVTTVTVPLTDVDRAVLDGETVGFARVHLKTGSDRILGATIMARHAGEMINEFSLAISNKLGLRAIATTIHPYPTQAEAIKKLADLYNRTRLTPLLKKILSGWLTWQRS